MEAEQFFSDCSVYDIKPFKNGVRLPRVVIEDKQKEIIGLKPKASNKEYLKKLTWVACQEKIASGKIKQTLEECVARLKMEFEVFEKTGTIDYLLLLMDIFLWCDKQNIPRGTGRGSACGAMTLYILDLTHVNPLDHNLNFHRFLNPARAKVHMVDGVMHVDGKSFADFDGDVSFLRRPEIIRRLDTDYKGKTCKILTLQHLTSKMALKDTVKSLLEYSESEVMQVSDLIESLYGKVDSLEATYKKNKKFQEWADKNKEAYSIALKIEGLERGSGQHASGVLISYYDIDTILPKETASTGEIVSGMDMNVALTVSLKADILGLRTLDVLQIASEKAGIKYDQIDIKDPSIYEYWKITDQFYNLFQISDGTTKGVILKAKPKNIDQLAACISISRPGALKYIPDYVKFTQNGISQQTHPAIDLVLEQTGGLILYQEQINRICQEVYKMQPVPADEVRRAISKKVREDMAKWEPILYEQGKKENIPEVVTKWFWDTCNASADYLFSVNHATAYCYITAYTAFVKSKYPVQFYLASLMMAQHESDPIECTSEIQNEMKKLKIPLLPPDITKSENDFTIEGNGIRMGLGAVRSLSDKGLEKMANFKTDGANKFDLFRSANEAGLSKSILTALIMAGCLPVSSTRAKLVLELEVYNLLTDREKTMIYPLGDKYGHDLLKIVKECVDNLKDEKGKPFIKKSRFETIQKHYEPFKQKYLHNSKNEKLCSYIMENEYLGFSYSTSLREIYRKDCPDLVAVTEVKNLMDKDRVRIAGTVVELEMRTSLAKQKPYLRIKLKDETGSIIAMMFGLDAINQTNQFNGKELEEGDVIIMNGSKSGDIAFINDFSIQENPVVIKVSKMKKEIVAT